MLVLSRRRDEQIIINGNIILTVVGVGIGKVKLGFDAPRDIVIDRIEVQERKEADACRPRVQPPDDGSFPAGPLAHRRKT